MKVESSPRHGCKEIKITIAASTSHSFGKNRKFTHVGIPIARNVTSLVCVSVFVFVRANKLREEKKVA